MTQMARMCFDQPVGRINALGQILSMELVLSVGRSRITSRLVQNIVRDTACTKEGSRLRKYR
jgi:hypothetical protein